MPEAAVRVRGALRMSRAAMAAAVVLGFATVAHAAAGGSTPGPRGTVVLFVLTFLGCAAALGRPASRLRACVLVAGGQAAVHAVLTAMHGHGETITHLATEPTRPPVPAGQPGNLRDALGISELMAQAPTGPDPVAEWFAHLQADLTAANGLMALAHLAAAALVGLWLAHGESALWSLFGAIAQRTLAAPRLLTSPVLGAVAALLARARTGVPRPGAISALRPRPLASATTGRAPPLAA